MTATMLPNVPDEIVALDALPRALTVIGAWRDADPTLGPRALHNPRSSGHA
jgi:hypothetical protein